MNIFRSSFLSDQIGLTKLSIREQSKNKFEQGGRLFRIRFECCFTSNIFKALVYYPAYRYGTSTGTYRCATRSTTRTCFTAHKCLREQYRVWQCQPHLAILLDAYFCNQRCKSLSTNCQCFKLLTCNFNVSWWLRPFISYLFSRNIYIYDYVEWVTVIVKRYLSMTLVVFKCGIQR